VLLATGVVNNRPEDASGALHDEALARGLLRYCPICDGYEVTDQRIGVIGTGGHGAREALFLRGYSADVTLLAPDGPHEIERLCREARSGGIARIDGPCSGLCDRRRPHRARHRPGPPDLRYDLSRPRLAHPLAPRGHRRRPRGGGRLPRSRRPPAHLDPGLFAAGDVAKGLDQISHAMGEGGVAATTIRNMLDEQRPIRR
jgi:thioredoxin reductase (NADPH)